MSSTPPSVDTTAAIEHTTTSRRTRAHVIVCHDLNAKSRSLLELFSLTSTVDPELCALVARDLAADILHDVGVLRAELDGIEAFARHQIAKLPTPLRE